MRNGGAPAGPRIPGSLGSSLFEPFIPSRASVPDSKRDHMTKGDILVVRRFVTLTLSFCLVLGVGILQVSPSFGQGEAKKATQPPQAR